MNIAIVGTGYVGLVDGSSPRVRTCLDARWVNDYCHEMAGVLCKPCFSVMKKSMKNAIIIDGRNIYDAKELAEAGFEYSAIGC